MSTVLSRRDTCTGRDCPALNARETAALSHERDTRDSCKCPGRGGVANVPRCLFNHCVQSSIRGQPGTRRNGRVEAPGSPQGHRGAALIHASALLRQHPSPTHCTSRLMS
jgi:hypothetical protein